MAAYVIVDSKVHDPETMKNYGAKVGETLKKYGGTEIDDAAIMAYAGHLQGVGIVRRIGVSGRRRRALFEQANRCEFSGAAIARAV